MPTLRRLLRRLIGLDSANSGNLPTTDERVDQLTAELAHLRETLGTFERQADADFREHSIVLNVANVSARIKSITAELTKLRESTCSAIAVQASLIQDTTNELRRNDQTIGTQLESFNRDAIARDVNLCVRIEVLEKLAAAAPSVFNLKPSEN
jgi:hypothetical protein